MTAGSASENVWPLGDTARGDLIRLGQVVRRLASKAERSSDLIALGEMWEAVEQIIEGQIVEVDVGFSVGFRRGSDKFAEGLFMCCHVDNQEIRLDELNTTYSRDVGSDHSSSVHVHLTHDGGWNGEGFDKWLDKLNEVLSSDDARLETEQNHG